MFGNGMFLMQCHYVEVLSLVLLSRESHPTKILLFINSNPASSWRLYYAQKEE
jgi:hypothetical protein